MKKNIWCVLFVGLSLGSCEYFKKQENAQNAVARLDNNYLNRKEIEAILPPKYSLEDSTRIASEYTNNWAMRLLLMQKAQENLPDNQLQNFEKLVEQYRVSLYTQSYLDMLIAQKTDTAISEAQKEQTYEQYKNALTLQEDLVKIRYIEPMPSKEDKAATLQRFKRFSQEDQEQLNNESAYFISSHLNDSTWLKAVDILEKIPLLKGKIDQKGKFFELTENQTTYWIYIADVLKKGQMPPKSYTEPMLQQIIMSQRKKEYAEKIKNDIIQQAIKRNQYEIYEK